MSFVNLNEIFLSTTGGTVNGDVKVEGAITVNNGAGEYDSVATMTEVNATIQTTIAATMTEVNATIQTAIGDAISSNY